MNWRIVRKYECRQRPGLHGGHPRRLQLHRAEVQGGPHENEQDPGCNGDNY
jgi:hypothetical protein